MKSTWSSLISRQGLHVKLTLTWMLGFPSFPSRTSTRASHGLRQQAFFTLCMLGPSLTSVKHAQPIANHMMPKKMWTIKPDQLFYIVWHGSPGACWPVCSYTTLYTASSNTRCGLKDLSIIASSNLIQQFVSMGLKHWIPGTTHMTRFSALFYNIEILKNQEKPLNR